jgi:hypothetical protein
MANIPELGELIGMLESGDASDEVLRAAPQPGIVGSEIFTTDFSRGILRWNQPMITTQIYREGVGIEHYQEYYDGHGTLMRRRVQ